MPNDSDKKENRPSTTGGTGDRKSQEKNDKGFSGGMHSLDSTQVPLRSSDGEPDWDAIDGKDKPTDSGNSKSK